MSPMTGPSGPSLASGFRAGPFAFAVEFFERLLARAVTDDAPELRVETLIGRAIFEFEFVAADLRERNAGFGLA
jgi:hypothetical protein